LRIDNFAQLISFPGQLYLFYLQMTVIPIVITAISSSMGKLMRNKSSAQLIKKIAAVFVICMIVCALIGMGIGFFGKPGSGLSEDTRSLLSEIITTSEHAGISGALEINLGSSQETAPHEQGPSMAGFFRNMIPSNIFNAISIGNTMAIVFFSIIFGVAIGFLPEDSAFMLINLLSAIFQAFQKLINWSLYLLPFGLICLLSGQIAAVGIQIFLAMSKFIVLYCIGTFIIFVICTFVIWIKARNSGFVKTLSLVFEPILLAFATRNSMATLPSAIDCLDKKREFDSTGVNLTLPLGMTLGRFGNILYFAVGVFFVAQIYNTPLGPIHYLIILIGVIFGGTATTGASGIVTLSMMSIVLDPLNLPMEAVLIIFMAIDTIIEPARTFLNVYVNMAATAIIVKKQKQFQVYIQTAQERPPFLYRRNKILDGLEIKFLREIAQRLDRKFVLKDAAILNFEEKAKTTQAADIIGGAVIKTQEPPEGFCFSQSWAEEDIQGEKKQICFLLPVERPETASINSIIEILIKQDFFKSLAAAERKRIFDV
jgi:proton glutamate symport protein